MRFEKSLLILVWIFDKDLAYITCSYIFPFRHTITFFIQLIFNDSKKHLHTFDLQSTFLRNMSCLAIRADVHTSFRIPAGNKTWKMCAAKWSWTNFVEILSIASSYISYHSSNSTLNRALYASWKMFDLKVSWKSSRLSYIYFLAVWPSGSDWR